jgi:hypothetical protein
MSSADEIWFSFLIVVLFTFLLFLRVKFSRASYTAETLVLAATTLLFFALCSCFLPRAHGELAVSATAGKIAPAPHQR